MEQEEKILCLFLTQVSCASWNWLYISGTTALKADLRTVVLLKRPADSWPHGQAPETSSDRTEKWVNTVTKPDQGHQQEQFKQEEGASWHAD